MPSKGTRADAELQALLPGLRAALRLRELADREFLYDTCLRVCTGLWARGLPIGMLLQAGLRDDATLKRLPDFSAAVDLLREVLTALEVSAAPTRLHLPSIWVADRLAPSLLTHPTAHFDVRTVPPYRKAKRKAAGTAARRAAHRAAGKARRSQRLQTRRAPPQPSPDTELTWIQCACTKCGGRATRKVPMEAFDEAYRAAAVGEELWITRKRKHSLVSRRATVLTPPKRGKAHVQFHPLRKGDPPTEDFVSLAEAHHWDYWARSSQLDDVQCVCCEIEQ